MFTLPNLQTLPNIQGQSGYTYSDPSYTPSPFQALSDSVVNTINSASNTIEGKTNNPLGLTTSGPGYSTNAKYPGQTGTQTSGLGYTFAQFPNVSTGFNAGVDYVSRKIQNGTVSTVGQLVGLFGASDMSAFSAAGYSANSPLDPSQASKYAGLIAQGEGNGDAVSSITNALGLGNLGSSGTSSSSSSNPLSAISSFFSLTTGERILAVIVGVLLVVIALISLISKSNTGQTIIESVRKGASTAALAV